MKYVRERQIYDLTYIWNLKNKINKKKTHKLINTENIFIVTRGEGWGLDENRRGRQRRPSPALKVAGMWRAAWGPQSKPVC